MVKPVSCLWDVSYIIYQTFWFNFFLKIQVSTMKKIKKGFVFMDFLLFMVFLIDLVAP